MTGYAMLYTSAVAVPVLFAALALSAVLRRYGRAERLVWLVALGLSFGLPLVMLLSPLVGIAGGASVAPVRSGVIGLPEVIVVPDGTSGFGVGEALMASWLLASMLLAIRWVFAARRLATASKSWRATELDGVAVWMTDDLGPAVSGVFRPRVLVPAWLRSLPGSQRALVLQHEEEHIRARDPIFVAVARLARVLTPWNPVVWILASRLVRAVELDCDRRVLRRSPDVAAYGRTLLSVSSRRPGRLVAVAAFAESQAPLRSRILAMTTPSRTVSIFALLSATVLGAILLVGALQIPVPAVSIQVQVTPQAREQARATLPEGEGRAATSVRESPEGQQGATEQSPPSSTQPTFTPYTVAPRILNRDEVVRAMTERYPALLRDAGIGGTVRVFFFIDQDGIVQATRIDRSSGLEALDRAALSVADVYRFSPVLNHDERVPVWVSFPITFQVRKEEL